MRAVKTFVFAAIALVFAHAAQAQQPAAAAPLPDRVLGKADAPVTIIEYASLTCPHCATFHKETLPKVKQEWLDTGKAKLVYVDFPFDALALGAAMIAHCAGPDRYFPMLDALFRSQDQWSRAQNPLAALQGVAKLGGMGPDKVEQCIQDNQLKSQIMLRQKEGQEKYQVNSTPSFIINGKKVSGAIPYDEFAKLLSEASPK